MAVYKVKVFDKQGVFDAVGQGVLRDIRDLGIESAKEARFAFLYYLSGDINETVVRHIAEELLIDKITQEYAIEPIDHRPSTIDFNIIEVAYNSGVMDPVEESLLKAVSDMGISGLNSARTARQYILEGSLSDRELKIISEKLLCNKVIQHVVRPTVLSPQSIVSPQAGYKFELITVDLLMPRTRNCVR